MINAAVIFKPFYFLPAMSNMHFPLDRYWSEMFCSDIRVKINVLVELVFRCAGRK